jgi:hypothetical protein
VRNREEAIHRQPLLLRPVVVKLAQIPPGLGDVLALSRNKASAPNIRPKSI